MAQAPMIPQKEAGRRLGVDPAAVSILIRSHRIPTHSVRYTGATRWLDREGFLMLLRAVVALKGLSDDEAAEFERTLDTEDLRVPVKSSA
jgi:hypothetical protein